MESFFNDKQQLHLEIREIISLKIKVLDGILFEPTFRTVYQYLSQRIADMYLLTDFSELSLDLFHQTHISAVDKVLAAPLLQRTHFKLVRSGLSLNFKGIFPHHAHLVTADFLECSVDVEQGHVVSLTRSELPARREHLFPPRRRVVQHRVH